MGRPWVRNEHPNNNRFSGIGDTLSYTEELAVVVYNGSDLPHVYRCETGDIKLAKKLLRMKRKDGLHAWLVRVKMVGTVTERIL